jgi:hypothetical protein
MAVLQPQKVIHASSHFSPMRSENKFLRILSLGPPTRSQLFAEAIWRYYPGYSPFRSCRARSRLAVRASGVAYAAAIGSAGDQFVVWIGPYPARSNCLLVESAGAMVLAFAGLVSVRNHATGIERTSGSFWARTSADAYW